MIPRASLSQVLRPKVDSKSRMYGHKYAYSILDRQRTSLPTSDVFFNAILFRQVKPNADSQDLIIQNLKTDVHGNGITVGELKHSTTLTGVAFSSAQGTRPAKVVDNIAGSGSVILSQNQKVPITSSTSAPQSAQQQQQNLASTNSSTIAGQNAVQNVQSIEKDTSGSDAANATVDPLLRSVASAQSWPVAAPVVPKKSRFTVKTIPVVEVTATIFIVFFLFDC